MILGIYFKFTAVRIYAMRNHRLSSRSYHIISYILQFTFDSSDNVHYVTWFSKRKTNIPYYTHLQDTKTPGYEEVPWRQNKN